MRKRPARIAGGMTYLKTQSSKQILRAVPIGCAGIDRKPLGRQRQKESHPWRHLK